LLIDLDGASIYSLFELASSTEKRKGKVLTPEVMSAVKPDLQTGRGHV